MIAKVTKRTEPEPSRALPRARHVRVKCGIRLGLAQRAQRTFTTDVVWRETFAQAACRV